MRTSVMAAVFICAGCVGPRASPTVPRDRGSARLFVSNEGSNDVSILDADSGRLLRTVRVGKRPRGIHLSPDGRVVLVAVSGSAGAPPGSTAPLPPPDHAADGLVLLDANTGEVLRKLSCGPDPENFALTPNGTIVAVSNEDDAQVSLVEVASGALVSAIPTGAEPEGVGVRPDGRVIYVTSEDEGTVSVVDPARRSVIATFPAGQRPRGVAFTSDGALAFVTGEQSRTVTVVDAQRHTVLDTIHLEGALVKPMGIVVAPDNRTVEVSTGRGGGVVTLDVARRRLVHTFASVGARPWGLALTRDGRTLFSANGPSNDVSSIDLATGVVRHFPAGERPWGVALVEP